MATGVETPSGLAKIINPSKLAQGVADQMSESCPVPTSIRAQGSLTVWALSPKTKMKLNMIIARSKYTEELLKININKQAPRKDFPF
jgi:hypothetical protein